MLKKPYLIGIVAIVLLGGFYLFSQNKTTNKSVDLMLTVKTPIEELKLIRLLADIHEGETVINTVSDYTKRDSVARNVYSKILAIHKVSMRDVDSALNAYIRQPQQAQALYEKVQNQISIDATSGN